MISTTVEAGDGSTVYLGSKKTSDMQENIQINDYRISGILKPVTGFEEFNPTDLSEQSGHYLTLTFKSKEETTIKTKIGVSGKEVEVTDGFCIYLVKDEMTQQIYVTTEKDGDSKTKAFDLTGLQLM